MIKILKILIISSLLLSVIPMIGEAQILTGVSVNLNIKYLNFDENSNAYRMLANISISKLGHLVYVEEYYTVDSNSNPKFVSSTKYYDGELSSGNVSFEILRPPHSYSLIKSIVILDDRRVLESWITRNKDFIDNTNYGNEDTAENIDKYETRDNVINSNYPTTFEYTSLGTVYEINATGKTGDLSLRAELLNGRPSSVYKPNVLVYKYVNIIPSRDINNVSIRYKVENSWINNMNISQDDLTMLLWDEKNKNWSTVATHGEGNDSEYSYFESISPSLSILVIVGSYHQNTDTIKPSNSTYNNESKNNTITKTNSEVNNQNIDINTLSESGRYIIMGGMIQALKSIGGWLIYPGSVAILIVASITIFMRWYH